VPQPGKRQLNAHLTVDAYERLQRFTAEQGTDMVAFLEALTLHLDSMPPRWRTDVIVDARRIHADRRRRAKD
jgi:hypothetical protein